MVFGQDARTAHFCWHVRAHYCSNNIAEVNSHHVQELINSKYSKSLQLRSEESRTLTLTSCYN